MLQEQNYVGRFAPSPTGKLHLGSLIAALASYCDAMKHAGKWLLRIEDLDPPREVQGATESIIKTLNNCGFQHHGSIMYQSLNKRQEAYQQALSQLLEKSKLYPCPCSRKAMSTQNPATHHCREHTTLSDDTIESSLKLKVANEMITFKDKIQGLYTKNLLHECGDCVIRRKDGLIAYQLAVVVDDNHQGVTHIVRGFDIIESTPWQIHLNSLLAYHQAQYAHIPILVDNQGLKLSKQAHAQEIDKEDLLEVLLIAYSYLNQTPFKQKPKSIDSFWSYAIDHWNMNKIAKVNMITV